MQNGSNEIHWIGKKFEFWFPKFDKYRGNRIFPSHIEPFTPKGKNLKRNLNPRSRCQGKMKWRTIMSFINHEMICFRTTIPVKRNHLIRAKKDYPENTTKMETILSNVKRTCAFAKKLALRYHFIAVEIVLFYLFSSNYSRRVGRITQL